MTQTKLGSFVEASTNTLIGFLISCLANIIVLPWFGLPVTWSKAFGIGVIFTIISIARSYILRRWFNKILFGNK